MSDDDVFTFEALREVQEKEKRDSALQEIEDDFFDKVSDYLKRKKRVDNKVSKREYENAKRITEDIIDRRERKIIELGIVGAKTNVKAENLLDSEKELLENVKEYVKRHREKLKESIFDQKDQKNDSENKEESQSKEESREEKEKETENNKGKEDEENNKEKSTDETSEEDNTMKEQKEKEREGEAEKESNKEEQLNQTEEKDKSENKGEKQESTELEKVRITDQVPEFLGVDLNSYGPFEEGDAPKIPKENAQVLIERELAEEFKADS